MAKPEFTFRYKVRNWPAYNRTLAHRGQLALWFDEAAIAAGRNMACNIGPGRPKDADAALECAVLNRMTGLGMPETVRMS